MPVFVVLVNSYDREGVLLPMPELVGVVTSKRTPEEAVAWTMNGEDRDVRDVTVECLAEGEYWFQEGPEQSI